MVGNPFGEKEEGTRMVKSLPAAGETWVQCLGWEDSLEEEMATHSTIFTWKTVRRVWWATVYDHKELDMTEHIGLRPTIACCSLNDLTCLN